MAEAVFQRGQWGKNHGRMFSFGILGIIHRICRAVLGNFSAAKNVRLFIASAAPYGGGSPGNMEPRFGLRCRGVFAFAASVRFLKSCLHHCGWTEDDLTRKLRCHRFIILQFPAEGAAGASAVFAISDFSTIRQGTATKASAVFAISNPLPRGGGGAAVGQLRLSRSGRSGMKSKKRSSELQSLFHALSFLPRRARGTRQKKPLRFLPQGLELFLTNGGGNWSRTSDTAGMNRML